MIYDTILSFSDEVVYIWRFVFCCFRHYAINLTYAHHLGQNSGKYQMFYTLFQDIILYFTYRKPRPEDLNFTSI